MNQTKNSDVLAFQWLDDRLKLLDQRYLPHQEIWITCLSAGEVAQAIKNMVVRGAPAIGIVAAYGALLSAQQHVSRDTDWKAAIEADLEILADARPTAVNLVWAVEQMRSQLASATAGEVIDAFARLATSIHNEDIAANLAMAEYALSAMQPDENATFSVMTHCNTGSLATGGFGTALGVIRHAWEKGVIDTVYAGETRPWLQGARLTAWELIKAGIEFRLYADSACAWIMQNKNVKWVIVGADRITANGDVANKIGTYSLAVNARYHGVKFMVVAPSSTVDMSLKSGSDIHIEMRDGQEVTQLAGQNLAPEGVKAINPVFDVTPASLVDCIVTEKGVVETPTKEKMRSLFLS